MPNYNESKALLTPARVHKMLQNIAIFASYAAVVQNQGQMKRTDLEKEIKKCMQGVEDVKTSKVVLMLRGHGDQYMPHLWTTQTTSTGASMTILRSDIDYVGLLT